MLLTLPPASKAEETKPLLELALNLLDVLAGGVVPSEVSNRGVRSISQHSRSNADVAVLPPSCLLLFLQPAFAYLAPAEKAQSRSARPITVGV